MNSESANIRFVTVRSGSVFPCGRRSDDGTRLTEAQRRVEPQSHHYSGREVRAEYARERVSMVLFPSGSFVAPVYYALAVVIAADGGDLFVAPARFGISRSGLTDHSGGHALHCGQPDQHCRQFAIIPKCSQFWRYQLSMFQLARFLTSAAACRLISKLPKITPPPAPRESRQKIRACRRSPLPCRATQ